MPFLTPFNQLESGKRCWNLENSASERYREQETESCSIDRWHRFRGQHHAEGGIRKACGCMAVINTGKICTVIQVS